MMRNVLRKWIAIMLVLPMAMGMASCGNGVTYQGKIVDVLQQRIFDGEITVEDGIITSVKECTLPEGTDYPYIMPGFIDSHVHIESSMILPHEYAQAAVRHGTIGCMADPHEIANVLGMEGVLYMIEQSKRVRSTNSGQVLFNILFGAPSCVPSCSEDIETNGAKIDAMDVAELLAMDEVGFLSEMMDYMGVLNKDQEVMAKIEAAHAAGKPVDGHAPELLGQQRLDYAHAGITTDHECSTMEEGRECIEAGMKLLVREGSAAKNYQMLIPLIDEYPDEVMLCTDDYNANELLLGHINILVKRALADGHDLWHVLKAACINPQQHYNVKWGLLQEGDPANFIMTSSVESDFRVLKTYLRGELVYDCESPTQSLLPIEGDNDATLPNNFRAQPINVDDIQTDMQPGDTCHIIVATDGSLLTGHDRICLTGSHDQDTWADVQKIVVYNRYHEGAKPVVGFIRGFNLTNGAMAASVAHDCHNIVAIGSSDDDIVRAVNHVIEMKGGLVAIAGDEMADLPLPVAGLMSPLPVEQVAQKTDELSILVRKAGCNMSAPFITMSFMCLPVIPELKITDKHLWDSESFRKIN